MLIRILRKNGQYDMVKPSALNHLLETDEIEQFLRSSGWVTIGRDQIRRPRNTSYNAFDRRQKND